MKRTNQSSYEWHSGSGPISVQGNALGPCLHCLKGPAASVGGGGMMVVGGGGGGWVLGGVPVCMYTYKRPGSIAHSDNNLLEKYAGRPHWTTDWA